MSVRKLAEYIVSEMDLRHLDAMGGAYFVLELLEVLEAAQAFGWTIRAPSDEPDPEADDLDERPPGP